MFKITDREFDQLAAYMKSNYGILIKDDKKYLIVGRLQSLLCDKGLNDFGSYYEYLTSDHSGNAAEELVNRLTTNHTYFLREVEHFDYFKTSVLPYLVSKYDKTKDLRIWSAGCSSGEEPYTLAMLIDEYFGDKKLLWDTKILATDISTKVIEKAVSATYLNEQLHELPENWRRKYFQRATEQSSRVVEPLKKEVIFRTFNLMTPVFPFKNNFHAIFCRNVMIYFDGPTKRELVKRFFDNTEPGGFLFIGHSESLSKDETKYKYVRPAVYRKE